MNMKLRRLVLVSIVVLTAASAAACSRMDGGPLRQQSRPPLVPGADHGMTGPNALSGGDPTLLNAGEGHLPIVMVDGKPCVEAARLTELLELQSDWDPTTGKIRFGDNDPEYELTGGSTAAVKEGDPVTLREAPIVSGDALHIPLTVLGELLAQEMQYEKRDTDIVLKPSNRSVSRDHIRMPSNPSPSNDELSFADDPADPNKGGDTPAILPIRKHQAKRPAAITAQANVDMNQLIATARRYLGVKYKFGADPYPESGVFDCSTFTQYVFGKYGVDLPRLSRTQAERGTLVSRKNLRKGDLMFFYVPGRFNTNETVGHVGIYIGNNEMIHSSPAPEDGVQITNIDQKYWKETFLRAKRVAD